MDPPKELEIRKLLKVMYDARRLVQRLWPMEKEDDFSESDEYFESDDEEGFEAFIDDFYYEERVRRGLIEPRD